MRPVCNLRLKKVWLFSILAEGRSAQAPSPGGPRRFNSCARVWKVKRHVELLSRYITNRDKVGFCRQVSITIPSTATGILLCSAQTEQRPSKPTSSQSYFQFFSFLLPLLAKTQAARKVKRGRWIPVVRLPTVIVWLQTLAFVYPASNDEDVKKTNTPTTQSLNAARRLL